jgi:glycosyltransferase involved in cell wall biosynthesis
MLDPTPPKRYTLSVGILALNEAPRIKACVSSALFADQVLVIDSGSTDGTRDIAQAAGAEVHMYDQWQGFAEQRNRLLSHVRADFIFFLDADEVITPELRDEILAHVATGRAIRGEIQWNQVAYGRALTAMVSTGGIQRLFLRSSIIRYEGVVHEGAVLHDPNTPVVRLRNRMPHYSRETVYDSLQKLAQYVQHGAAKRYAAGKTGGLLRGFGSGLAIFIRLYFFRRGFLCGAEGFLFCFMIALECFFRYAALKYDRDHLSALAKR